jgi:drug/metabolite transporter (DMT)-like permease
LGYLAIDQIAQSGLSSFYVIYYFAKLFSVTGIISVLFQSIIVGFASYLAWFSLMRKYLVSQLGVLSFMTPVFGIVTAILILREKPQPGFVLGAILILGGISIVSGWLWFKARFLTLSIDSYK